MFKLNTKKKQIKIESNVRIIKKQDGIARKFNLFFMEKQ